MATINIPPTRSNLLRMKQELRFAHEGYEILDRKREVLTTELIRMAHDAQVLQEEVWKLVAEAYRALEQAKLTMGQEHVERTCTRSPGIDRGSCWRSHQGRRLAGPFNHPLSQGSRVGRRFLDARCRRLSALGHGDGQR